MNSKMFPFEYDHAVALINKDIWQEEGKTAQERSLANGVTYFSGICRNRFSIVEEVGGFSSVGTVTHELGHNLGANHDGIVNLSEECSADSNYIMTPNIGLNQNDLYNLQHFSLCSKRQIKELLLTNNTHVSGEAQCLFKLPVENLLLENQVNGTLPGQLWSADEQCKMIYGKTATFCHELSGQMCTSLACRISDTVEQCTFINGIGAAIGTTCEYGKICLGSVCTTDSRAPMPAHQDTKCIFGDDIITNTISVNLLGLQLPHAQMTCENLLSYATNEKNLFAPALCLNQYFRVQCCQTCKKYDVLKCFDLQPNCPSFQNLCQTKTTINDIYIENLCIY
jgi:hypothetical protein